VADKFPSDFYVTCATVIPVLFLAVAVQGRTFESVLRNYRTADRASAEDLALKMRGVWTRRGRAKQVWLNRMGSSNVRASNAALAATWIMLAGTVGEFIALVSLYRGSEVTSGRATVLVATLILVVAVAAGPFWSALRVPPPPGSANQRTAPSEPKAAENQPGEPGPGDGTGP
jgi:hypothetical protein